jgi:hypothetical protein
VTADRISEGHPPAARVSLSMQSGTLEHATFVRRR